MQILLVRHAEAVDMRSALSDYDRWLTEAGRRAMTKVGESLSTSGLRYTQVYTSPLVRAVQTAEILAASAPAFDGPLEVHRALSTEEGTTAEVLAPLEQAPDDALIVMVTHMPKVGVLTAHLGGLVSAPAFRTGSACLLSVADGSGRVEWMLDPSSLERRHP